VSGPEYQQIFTATVFLGEEEQPLASGKGSSKRKAQLAAAEKAWHSLSEQAPRTDNPDDSNENAAKDGK
ncbi:MAG: putative dsRNA-binding protein, partial [Bifidobacterium crudilactis]|nr:putative dsRNA-binding protein [Bifidobacterium crudilactis]